MGAAHHHSRQALRTRAGQSARRPSGDRAQAGARKPGQGDAGRRPAGRKACSARRADLRGCSGQISGREAGRIQERKAPQAMALDPRHLRRCPCSGGSRCRTLRCRTCCACSNPSGRTRQKPRRAFAVASKTFCHGRPSPGTGRATIPHGGKATCRKSYPSRPRWRRPTINPPLALRDVADWWAALAQRDGMAARALQFLALDRRALGRGAGHDMG